MNRKILLILMLAALPSLSACGAALVGAGGAVVADKVAEEENGGDGLF